MRPYQVCLIIILALTLAAAALWGWRTYNEPPSSEHSISDTIVLLSIPDLSDEDNNLRTDRWDNGQSAYKWLAPFYDALAYSREQTIRVVHYGDSQIEGDRMTFVLRRALQDRFGGNGVGLLPLYQTLDVRTSLQTIQHANRTIAPKVYRAYGPTSYRRSDGLYGPMAQVYIMDNVKVAGSEDLVWNIRTRLNGPESRFTRIRIVAEQDSFVYIPDTVSSYTLHLTGKQLIYGISAETPTGIQVDNIPMRGCAGTIFTHIDSTALSHYFDHTRTRLIIWQFSGNVVPYVKTDQQITHYVNRVKQQIRYLHQVAPAAAILMIGPSDMLYHEGGQRKSYRVLPALDKALQTAAEEERAAYWSLFDAMGGAGSMNEWIQQGLAGQDGIHFTRNGADKAGQLLSDYLLFPINNANGLH